MTFILSKLSAPGWQKTFPDMASAVDELRLNICRGCLAGGGEFDDPILDGEIDGVKFECRDADLLLATACGCEFMIEDEEAALE